MRWRSDGHSFTYTKIDRGHQRYRVVEVDTRTGRSSNIIDEQTDTFLWTAHTENVSVQTVTWLEETHEIIYVSEVDGWRPIDRYDDESSALSDWTFGSMKS